MNPEGRQANTLRMPTLIRQYRQTLHNLRRKLSDPATESTWESNHVEHLRRMIRDVSWTIRHLSRTYLPQTPTAPPASKCPSEALEGVLEAFKTRIRVLGHVHLGKRNTTPFQAVRRLTRRLTAYELDLLLALLEARKPAPDFIPEDLDALIALAAEIWEVPETLFEWSEPLAAHPDFSAIDYQE